MKKTFVVLASLALALAANFGVASAHPLTEPTPPANPTPRVDQTAPGALLGSEVDEEGDHQNGAVDQSQAGDMNESNSDVNESGAKGEDATGNATTTTGKDQPGQLASNTQQDGEFDGDK